MSDLDFNMDVRDSKKAEQEISSSGGPRARSSKYEPIAKKYSELDEGKAILLKDLSQNDVQNLRNLLYRRFGKEDVIVRSKSQGDDTYKAVVRDREGGEYLRDNGEEDTSQPTSEENVDEEVEDVF